MGASSTHAYVLELALDTASAKRSVGFRAMIEHDLNVYIVLAHIGVNLPGVHKFLVCGSELLVETNSTSHVRLAKILHHESDLRQPWLNQGWGAKHS